MTNAKVYFLLIVMIAVVQNSRHLLAVDRMVPLLDAVHRDDLEAVKSLLKNDADANEVNDYNVTPLSLAAINGNAEMVTELLAAGADVNLEIGGGETPLMTASRTGRIDVVRKLIEAGAKVNAKEHHDQTAIMWAANEGHLDVVDALLKAGAEFRQPLKSGFTPLTFAVRQGKTAVALRLIEAGADVREPMQVAKRGGKAPLDNSTPLILAVENGHFETAVALVRSGADPNDQRCGYSPLHILTWVRKPNRGDDDDGAPPPEGSGAISSLDFARRIVELGADVNLRLKKGSSGKAKLNLTGATPFLMASKTADLPFLRVLLELGADPLKTNIDGCTAFMAAAGIGTMAPGEEAGTESEVLATIEFLLPLGFDLNAIDQHGETAMHGAAYKNLPEVVRLLAAKGADPAIWNQKNSYDWTPMRIAEGYRVGNFKPHPDTIQALQEVMADIR